MEDQADEGQVIGAVLRLTVARGTAPQVEILRTTRFSWKDVAFQFHEDSDLDRFITALDDEIGTHSDENLLSLLLEGLLGIAAASRLEQILESWESRLVRLKLDHRVVMAPSHEEINALTQRAADPLISNVATELVARIEGDDEDAAIARFALRELHAALS